LRKAGITRRCSRNNRPRSGGAFTEASTEITTELIRATLPTVYAERHCDNITSYAWSFGTLGFYDSDSLREAFSKFTDALLDDLCEVLKASWEERREINKLLEDMPEFWQMLKTIEEP
jgi:hypothetical protein